MTAPPTPAIMPPAAPVLAEEIIGPPALTYGRLFLRFLRFGLLAWGGPVAQIAMLRQELVEEQHWVSRARFNRVLAVYQVLPGPEAHELCVYFGYLARGRVGGLLAGLGFMLPGLLLMLRPGPLQHPAGAAGNLCDLCRLPRRWPRGGAGDDGGDVSAGVQLHPGGARADGAPGRG